MRIPLSIHGACLKRADTGSKGNVAKGKQATQKTENAICVSEEVSTLGLGLVSGSGRTNRKVMKENLKTIAA